VIYEEMQQSVQANDRVFFSSFNNWYLKKSSVILIGWFNWRTLINHLQKKWQTCMYHEEQQQIKQGITTWFKKKLMPLAIYSFNGVARSLDNTASND
jgi:hypothetical protein